jgi:hypothetical protein
MNRKHFIHYLHFFSNPFFLFQTLQWVQKQKDIFNARDIFCQSVTRQWSVNLVKELEEFQIFIFLKDEAKD